MCGWGTCVVGSMHGRGACVARDMHGGDMCGGGVHGSGHTWQEGGMCAGEMAIEAGGAHPTGMHSCSLLLST